MKGDARWLMRSLDCFDVGIYPGFLTTLVSVTVVLVFTVTLPGFTSTYDQGFNNPRETGFYVGVSGVDYELETDIDVQYSGGFFYTERAYIDAGGAMIHGGLSLNRYLSTEARIGVAGEEGSDVVGGDTTVRFTPGPSAGVFAKIKYPSYIIPYGLVGVSYVSGELCIEGDGCSNHSRTEPTVGGGLKLPLRGDFLTGLFVEAVEYFDDDETRLDSVQVGLTIGF